MSLVVVGQIWSALASRRTARIIVSSLAASRVTAPISSDRALIGPERPRRQPRADNREGQQVEGVREHGAG